MLGQNSPLAVDEYGVPGPRGLNYVVKIAMAGGVLALIWSDLVANGMVQPLLDFPVPVIRAIYQRLVDTCAKV